MITVDHWIKFNAPPVIAAYVLAMLFKQTAVVVLVLVVMISMTKLLLLPSLSSLIDRYIRALRELLDQHLNMKIRQPSLDISESAIVVALVDLLDSGHGL